MVHEEIKSSQTQNVAKLVLFNTYSVLEHNEHHLSRTTNNEKHEWVKWFEKLLLLCSIAEIHWFSGNPSQESKKG